jgi:phage-related protein
MAEVSKIKIAEMQKDIEHIKENVGKIEAYIKEDREWKVEFERCLDKRYAGKWTEALTLGALLTAIGAIIKVILEGL